jgi:transposase
MTAPTASQKATAKTGIGAQDIPCAKARNHREYHRAGRDEFTTWLTASCQRQGIPVTITDPTTLATVATLLR